jgi:hypothetical protein
MISAGSAIPKISSTCKFPGTRGRGLRRRWRAMPSALIVVPCLLVQGCGNSDTRVVAKADPARGDPAMSRSTSAKGDILVPRPAPARDSFADRYFADSFAERYSGNGSFGPAPALSSLSRSARETGGNRGAANPPGSFKLASLSPELPYPLPTVKHPQTRLIGFENSAFPYFGSSGAQEGGRYSDNRVLVHVPAGFDVRKPAVIVVFFHGHGATLSRDVRDRQLLPSQISESGVNAVLVAPQLAYDAADSSAGKFSERGGFKRFMAEAADQLARVYGDARAADAFAKMPVVVVAYSGGFVAAAHSLHVGGLGNRVVGVVLLDAIYGQMDKFSSWIANNRSAFFVSAYTEHNKRRDDELARMLRDKSIPVSYELKGPLKPGTVALLATGEGVRHRDYVTLAWTEHPVRDVLDRMSRR